MRIPDQSGVEASQGFDLLPKGDYIVSVMKAEEATSSRGNPGIRLEMDVMSPPAHKGRKVWADVWITPKAIAAGMVRAPLEALGLALPAGDFDLEPRALVGKGAQVTIGHEDWEDKDGRKGTSARVTRWKRPEGASAPTSPFTPGAPGAPAAGAQDDDIPF